MKWAMPAPKPTLLVGLGDRAAGREGGLVVGDQRGQRRLVGDQGAHILGMRGHERERVDGAATAGEQVDRSQAQRLDDPMDVVRVLLGRRLAGRVVLGAPLDAARVIRDDGAVGKCPESVPNPPRAHGRADEHQRPEAGVASPGRTSYVSTAPGTARVRGRGGELRWLM